MSKTLNDLFNEATVQELDTALDRLDLEPLGPDVLDRVRENVCAMISPHTSPIKKHPSKKWRTIAAAAACFVLVAAIAGGSYAYAAEAREYNAALDFFDDYDLSTESLSRSEIKAVYRDITTQSFSYSKTAEVIAESLSDQPTAGFEILQADPNSEDIKNLWNYKNYDGMYWVANSSQIQPEEYRIRTEEKLDPELGFDILDRCHFEKYDRDELVWSVSYTDFWIEDYVCVRDGVIVYGQTDTWSSEQPRYAWISKIDPKGAVLWTRKLENGFRKESIAAVLEHEDGSYAVFSRGELKYLCLSRLDKNGRQVASHQTEVGNYGIWNAARFGDGYLIQLGSFVTNEQAKIVKVDAAGTITDSFSYSSEDHYYYITDMMEFDGNLYISAYTIPKNEANQTYSGGHYEIASILDELLTHNQMNISSEDLTPMVRNNYTAVLLVCDPAGGTPQEFYSVEGSLGGVLSHGEDGTLQWDVESITTTYFSPYTSAFSIGGTSYVYRYTFDQMGTLVNQKKTGQVSQFSR